MINMKKSLRQNLKGLTKTEYEILRSLAHLSKNLYNETLYEVRQYFFDNGEYLNYYNAWKRLKPLSENYPLLPSHVAQQTMKNVDKAFQSFFKLIEKKREGKYDGRVNIPKYLDKDGVYMLDFTNQMFQVKEDYIRIGVPKKFREEFGYEQTEIRIPFTYKEVKNKELKRLQILPRGNNGEYFEYRIVYETEPEPIEPDKNTFLSIDLGVSNLATCVDHTGHSFIVDGCKLKSINRWYNKEMARLRGIKDKQGIKGDTKRISKLFRDRNNKMHDYLNKAVHHIIEYCRDNRIGTVLVGDGKGWKQKVNIGKRNNQNFVQIPFDKFKQKLKHKCEYYGIEYKLVNEAHTSKCSFFDGETVEHHEEYLGKRIKRGLFKTEVGRLVNADVNGALNIARKSGMLEPALAELESSGVVDTPHRIRMVS